MDTESTTAGQPGALSCSKGQQAEPPSRDRAIALCKLAGLVSGLSHDLSLAAEAVERISNEWADTPEDYADALRGCLRHALDANTYIASVVHMALRENAEGPLSQLERESLADPGAWLLAPEVQNWLAAVLQGDQP